MPSDGYTELLRLRDRIIDDDRGVTRMSDQSEDATHRVDCSCGRTKYIGDQEKAGYVDYDRIAESFAGAHEFTHDFREEEVELEVTELAE
jgi:hypothetical protein